MIGRGIEMRSANMTSAPARKGLDYIFLAGLVLFSVVGSIQAARWVDGLTILPWASLAGLIAGGALGHLAGRVSLAAEPGSTTRGIIRSTLGVGGAAVGIATGLYAGFSGGLGASSGPLMAGLAAGAWGGLCLGVLIDQKRGRKADDIPAMPLSQLGLMGGAMLGLATAVSGSPYLGVATAALGAVGGACLSRMAPE